MSRYYFLAATLPSLQFGMPAPFSRQAFLELCARSLSHADLAVLESIALLSQSDAAPPSLGSALLDSYYLWERGLRNELAKFRARKLGLSPESYLREDADVGSSPARSAHAAFHASTPLEGELVLERERWAFVDGLAPIQKFDMESLAAYLLKLLILERLGGFAAGPGEAGYRKVYADIMESRHSGSARSSSKTGVPR